MNLPGFTALPIESTPSSAYNPTLGGGLAGSRPVFGMPWDTPQPQPHEGGCRYVGTEEDCAGLVTICNDIYVCGTTRQAKRTYPCGACFGIGKKW